MARAGITYAEVISAADHIIEIGEQPTIERVRIFLGAGSNTTISKYLNQWKASNEGLSQVAGDAADPDVVQMAVKSAWDKLRQKSEDTIRHIQDETSKQVNEAEIRASQAEAAAAMLQSEFDTLQKANNQLAAKKELLTLGVKKLEEELTLLKQSYADLDARYVDMKDLSDHHLAVLKDAHQKDIARMEAHVEKQEAGYIKLINQYKEINERERHENMLMIDQLKVKNTKLEDIVKKQDQSLIEKEKDLGHLRAEFTLVKGQQEKTENLLLAQEKNWAELNCKQLISDALVESLNELPNHLEAELKARLHSELEQGIEKLVNAWLAKPLAKVNG